VIACRADGPSCTGCFLDSRTDFPIPKPDSSSANKNLCCHALEVCCHNLEVWNTTEYSLRGPFESAGFIPDAALSAPCGFGAFTAFLYPSSGLMPLACQTAFSNRWSIYVCVRWHERLSLSHGMVGQLGEQVLEMQGPYHARSQGDRAMTAPIIRLATRE
jgi:hypothetical protein